MLAFGSGFTVRLTPEQGEQWRVGSTISEQLFAGQYQENPGEYCATCPWLAPFRLSSESFDGESF
jgi:hypothetical protein